MAVAKYRDSVTGNFVPLGYGSSAPSGGGATALNDLTDVATTSPQSAQFLGWDGTQWTNKYPPSVSTSGTIYATPANFPGIDPSGASSSSTGMASFVAAIPAGGIGVIPPGTYWLDDILTISGKSTRITAVGATFISSDPTGAVRFVGGYEATKTVTGIVEESNATLGHSGESMFITKLTMTATAPTSWKRGDILKVVSEQIYPDSTDGSRNGQCCVIAHINGAEVWIAGYLRDSFTSGIRCARFVPYRMMWEGGEFRHHDSILADTAAAPFMFMFDNLNQPIVRDVRITASAATGFYMRKCFAARVDSCTMDYGQDGESSSKLGYGVTDGGEYTTVYNFVAKRVRHAFTTASSSTPANSANLGDYGHQYGATVSDCVAIGTTQTAFDTHGDAVQTTFSNCRAFDCYQGFLLRGTFHNVIGGAVLGKTAATPVTVNTASSAANSYGSFIGGGLVIDGTAWHCIEVKRTAAPVETKPTYVDGVFIRNRVTTQPVIRADNATVQAGRILAATGGTPLVTVNGGVIQPIPYLTIP